MAKKYQWDTDARPMRYFHKPCKHHNHHDSTGAAVYIIGGGCIACWYGLPDGFFEHSFKDIAPYENKSIKYATEEEKKQAHIDRVKAWNKQNKDKTKEYQKTYYSKPEVIEARREYANSKYVPVDPDKRRINRPNKLTHMTPEEKREYINRRERERYNALTQEQKTERYLRNKARVLAKRLREKDD